MIAIDSMGDIVMVPVDDFKTEMNGLLEDINQINSKDIKSKIVHIQNTGLWETLLRRTSQLEDYGDAVVQVKNFLKDMGAVVPEN